MTMDVRDDDSVGTRVLPSEPSSRRAWGMTSLLLLLTILNYSDQAVFGIIAQPIADELGLSSSQIGLVGSLFYLTLTAGGLLTGLLNRWMSLRWAMVLLAFAWSFTAVPLIAAASLATLIISRLLLGLAEGPSAPLIFTATYSWHPASRRGFTGAVLTSAAAFTQFAVIPALAFVTVKFGWRAALVCLAVATAVWCVVWLARWKEGPYLGKSAGEPNADEVGTEEIAKVPWSRIFLTKTFVTSAALGMSVFALGSAVLTWLPSYFEVGLGYSRLEAGTLSGLPAILGLAIALTTSVLSDRLFRCGSTTRFVRIIIPSVGVLISGAVLVSMPAITTPAVAVAAISLGYGFSLPTLPLVQAAIVELSPPRQTAGTLGVLIAIFTTGGLIAPYATGLIVDAASTPAAGYTASFQVFGLIAAVCAVLTISFAKPEKDSPRP